MKHPQTISSRSLPVLSLSFLVLHYTPSFFAYLSLRLPLPPFSLISHHPVITFPSIPSSARLSCFQSIQLPTPPLSFVSVLSLSHHPVLAPPSHPPAIPFPIHPRTLFSASSPPRLPCYLPQLLNYYGRFSGDNLGTKCLPVGTKGSSYQVEATG